MGMKSKIVKKAFVKTLPVMAGYIVLGTGFGILLRSAGFGVGYALAMSLFIYAGSMQYVGVGLLAGGASALSSNFKHSARRVAALRQMVPRGLERRAGADRVL